MQNWERHYDGLANDLTDRGVDLPAVITALKGQVIELPSWAVGNSGTRSGVFRQAGTGAEYLGQNRRLRPRMRRAVGICPVMASHVLWDVTDDGRYEPVRTLCCRARFANRHGASEHLHGTRVSSGQHLQPDRAGATQHHRPLRRLRAHRSPRDGIAGNRVFGWPTAPTTRARTIYAAASSVWLKGCRRCTTRWTLA